MAFRMSYSKDTVWPKEYVPTEYHDVQWIDSTPTGDVQYTGNVDKSLVRSITWSKDNMSFLVLPSACERPEAEFYKDHGTINDIDPVVQT